MKIVLLKFLFAFLKSLLLPAALIIDLYNIFLNKDVDTSKNLIQSIIDDLKITY
jgi:hypothetical protein